jgi:hypothetical protein
MISLLLSFTLSDPFIRYPIEMAGPNKAFYFIIPLRASHMFLIIFILEWG